MLFDQFRRRDFITLFGGATAWPLATAAQDRPVSRTAAIVIAIVWAACIAVAGWLCYRFFMS